MHGVVIGYEQGANLNKERERKKIDMEIRFDGKTVAIDYTIPNALNLNFLLRP
jgi:hypothetical protein